MNTRSSRMFRKRPLPVQQTCRVHLKLILSRVQEFFGSNEAPGAERTVLQSCEKIQANIAWAQRDLIGIEEYLKERDE